MSTTTNQAARVRRVQELRRGSAATPVPARKVRRQATRADARRAAVADGR